MRRARALRRATLLALLTACLWPLFFLARLLRPLAPGPSRRACAALLGAWARGGSRLLGMRVEVRGRPPEPPFFLVANHLSYVDVLVLWSALDCAFLAKSEVARWPVIGFLARSVGTLFVDRTRRSDLPRVIAELRRELADRRGVVVFPEGTSSAGETVLPFKPSLFEVATRAGLSVSCAALSYATSPGEGSARELVCWWGDMSFLPHFSRLLGLESFQASLSFAPAPQVDLDRKALAQAAQRAVSAEFTQVPA